MPKTYSRDCNLCGKPYEGWGKKYCSPECAQEAQKNEAVTTDELDDLPPEGEVSINEDHREDTYMVQVKGREEDAPKTKEDLLELTEADMDVWEVDMWEVKPYTGFFKHEDLQKAVRVPMYSSRIRFKKRDDRFIQQAIEKSIQKMAQHAPEYADVPSRPELPSERQHMLELVLPDLHLGSLAWEVETGENYDSNIAISRYQKAVRSLLERSQIYGVEKILLVIGNDFFHTDKAIQGSGGSTARGTPQDVDSRRHKMLQRGCDLLVHTIDYLLGTAPVKVIAVPGNHDKNESINVARYLAAWYRNTDEVTVDAEPRPRKYEQYGKNMIGFTHGSEEKRRDLPSIMPVEKPQMWANTKWREFHLGHNHRKKSISMLSVNEEKGVRTRILSCLAGIDAWHFERGYVGNIRSAEAFIWHKEQGLKNIINWNLDDE